MKNKITPALLGLLLAGATSCKESSDNEPKPSSNYRVFLSVKSPAPGTTSPRELRSTDSEEYSCANYELLTTLQRQGNTLRLDYTGAKAPEICLTALGPAFSLTSLQELPAQRYDLHITVKGRHTTGVLDLTTSPIQLSIADTTVAAVRP
ncbi:hypothetical protein [Hymenobacter weizhouensis]|uniref:hypothetical protein n=1 Tax=Hymenobacter sp. YIM 151500-1 TaxID=2987689 RepID=UPI0022270D15|nr:hypothetical protein [Hymenobacter sp. YIM 151500-1]UYZ63557.1 hypothetical protein OIS53_01640 [Hymenobacter sp. YIM 151500-1]